MSLNKLRALAGLPLLEEVSIEEVAASLEFKPVSKKKLVYTFDPSGDKTKMKAMSYTVAREQQKVVTFTSDGKETSNVAEPNDIIMSGPSKEKYVLKAAKFPKLYSGKVGEDVYPEQSPRQVAKYSGKNVVMFTASWGEQMPLKPGDYLVKDGDKHFYRIAKKEFELTYNKL